MNCKDLVFNLNKITGRNNLGRYVIKTKSGGFKRKYRLVDFKRSENENGYVIRIERDTNRNSFIALICYTNRLLSYIIATETMEEGQFIKNISLNILNYKDVKFGNSILLRFLPVGSIINNIELYPTRGSKLIRSAGGFAQVIKKYNANYILVKLRSGEQRLVNRNCRVVLGVNSNINYNLLKLNKAGQSRWLGIKPTVRGISKNPVDHPHGGRTNGGIFPRTPSGYLTKGVRTRRPSNNSYYIIVKRH